MTTDFSPIDAFAPKFTLRARMMDVKGGRWEEYSIPTVRTTKEAINRAIRLIDTIGVPCVRVEIWADGRYIKEVPSDEVRL